MSFTAADVKKLREMTGAGMMDCKNALKENDGNVESAVDYLRKKGLAAAQKKQSRVAAEGTVVTLEKDGKAVVVEVNCETDFVSKGDDFQNFAKSVAEYVLENEPADINELKDAKSADVNELTLKIGEKVDIRRFTLVKSEGVVGSYNHGGRIGVLVNLKTSATGSGVETLAKDLAMHTAAASPKFVDASDIDEEFKKKEAEIYAAQLREEGKPENMIEKIVQGKLNKLAKEVCLLEQAFVKNPDQTVKKLIAESGTDSSVVGFSMLVLGEGIEKKEDNLAEEVAKMAGKQ